MLDKLRAFFKNLNVNGVSMPTVSDPLTGHGSITCTLVVVSSVAVLASLISKKIDSNNAIHFFLISLGSYLGRKYQKGNETIADVEDKTDK